MENELKITIEIFPKENKIYIAEESSSGAGYRFNNVKELAEKIYFYLDNYYKEEIEGSKEEYHIINEENIVDYREEIDSNIHNVIKGYILNLIETTYPEILQKNLLSREKIGGKYFVSNVKLNFDVRLRTK